MPLNKIEDFGAHQNQYYQLEISYFKSASDTALLNAIWNKYWIATLSASPLLNNSHYITSQVWRVCVRATSPNECGWRSVRLQTRVPLLPTGC